MTSDIRPLIVGNWKMNGIGASLCELQAIAAGLHCDLERKLDVVMCVPATLLSRAVEILSSERMSLGGQDCHVRESGAYTGDISALMLKEAGATHVIVGHSERRVGHGETDKIVCEKAEIALKMGLVAIICIGETASERQEGRMFDVIGNQLHGSLPDGADSARVVIAYEPVWAIGTGLTPVAEDIQIIHAFVRQEIVKRFGERGVCMHLLYGGSVNQDNAADLLGITNVDGALIGRASLKASDFLAICETYRNL